MTTDFSCVFSDLSKSKETVGSQRYYIVANEGCRRNDPIYFAEFYCDKCQYFKRELLCVCFFLINFHMRILYSYLLIIFTFDG